MAIGLEAGSGSIPTRVGEATWMPPFDDGWGAGLDPSGAERTGSTLGEDGGVATATMRGWLDDGLGAAGRLVSARGIVPPQTAQKR